MNVQYSRLDQKFMSEALLEAQNAINNGEVPVGAIVVDNTGRIIGRGFNAVESSKCQLGHAEVFAIKEACDFIGDWRLDGCSIYVTLEPCLMCFGLITLSRVKTVYFGAKSPLFGAQMCVKTSGLGYSKNLEVHGDLKEIECTAILRLFFEQAREERDGRETKTCVPRSGPKATVEKARGDNRASCSSFGRGSR